MRLPQLLTVVALSCAAGPDLSLLKAATAPDATPQMLDASIDDLVRRADDLGPITLASGARLANARGRLEDAAFLLWAAQARARMESGPPPAEPRMMSPREYMISQVLGRESPAIERAVLEDPTAYAGAVQRLRQWIPTFGDEAWYAMEGPKPSPPSDFVTSVRETFVRDLRISSALLKTPEWKDAKESVGSCLQQCCPRTRSHLVRQRRIELDTVMGLARTGDIPWSAWHSTLDELTTDPSTRAVLRASLTADKKALRKHRRTADLNGPGTTGRTPLTWLLAMEDADATQRLLDAGADPNTPDATGLLPLQFAATLTTTEPMRVLLDAGASVEGDTGPALLQEAMEEGCVSAAELLVDRGVSPKDLDVQGMLRAGAWSTVQTWMTSGRITDVDAIALAAELAALNTPNCSQSRSFLEAVAARGASMPTEAWTHNKSWADPACFPESYSAK